MLKRDIKTMLPFSDPGSAGYKYATETSDESMGTRRYDSRRVFQAGQMFHAGPLKLLFRPMQEIRPVMNWGEGRYIDRTDAFVTSYGNACFPGCADWRNFGALVWNRHRGTAEDLKGALAAHR